MKGIAPLCETAQDWTQPKCPTIENWLSEIYYIHSIEYYAAETNEGNLYIDTISSPRYILKWKKATRRQLYTLCYL